jgi:hypothetical protein
MKLLNFLKKRKVKSPVKSKNGIDFFVPDDFPGNHFLAPNQSVRIYSGLEIEIPKGYALFPVTVINDREEDNFKIDVYGTTKGPSAGFHIRVTNIGDQLALIRPGQLIFRALFIPIFDMEPSLLGS